MSRFPTRPTDRVEDLSAWLLTSLGLLALLGAVLVGRAAHDAALEVGGSQPVTLLADAPPPGPAPTPPVPVTWLDGDGTEEVGELAVHAPLRAGTSVVAWRTVDGRLSPVPTRNATAAAAFGIGAALTAGALLAALLVASWAGVRRLTAARNAAWWAREWARVEPVWRRQVT